MSSDLRKQFEGADWVHDAGLISDDEMNDIAARYFAQGRGHLPTLDLGAANPKARPTPQSARDRRDSGTA